MTHPSRVAAGYKAALRDAQAEKQLTPKDRVIAEQDQRIEADGKRIRDLKHQLDCSPVAEKPRLKLAAPT